MYRSIEWLIDNHRLILLALITGALFGLVAIWGVIIFAVMQLI